MKVILLKDVKGVGRRFEEKNVSDGYATNSLIPKKLAVPVGSGAAAQIKALKEQDDKNVEKELERIQESIAKIANTEVKVSMMANDKGHLFAALNAEKVSLLLKKEAHVEVDPEYIVLDKPIKETGTHRVPVLVPGGKETHLTLIIEPK